ncbi:MAG: methyltransferase domain-containing protein, partial [Pseudomonadota bacterium]
MDAILDAAKRKAEQTYDAAADCFDAAPLTFWRTTGRKTVELLNLAPGACVLDVGCGSGASALPAAKAVGSSGHVTGLDLSDNLLTL